MNKILIILAFLVVALFVMYYIIWENNGIVLNIQHENISHIEIHSQKSKKKIDTKENDIIKKIVKELNNSKYHLSSDNQIGSSSPDAWIIMHDELGVRSNLYFYGDIAMYNKEKYKCSIFIYNKINNIIDKYGN